MNNTERVVGRVIKEIRHSYKIEFNKRILTGEVSGAFHYRVVDQTDYPTIGDEVRFRLEGDFAYIEEVLPRRTKLSRKVTGDRAFEKLDPREQIIAANMDKVVLVFAIDGTRSLSAGGVDRYVSIAWESGATPVIILNKEDLCQDILYIKSSISELAQGVEVFYTSAITGSGIDSFKESIRSGESFVFIGPSGAGKSSIINALVGESVMATGRLRSGDGQGRHTTTHKEIITLKNGAKLYDCPGMREIQIWGDSSTLDSTFSDIYELSKDCKFNNCNHDSEPGCRIKKAILNGELTQKRFNSFLKLKKELERLEFRKMTSANYLEKEKWKKIHINYTNRNKIIY